MDSNSPSKHTSNSHRRLISLLFLAAIFPIQQPVCQGYLRIHPCPSEPVRDDSEVPKLMRGDRYGEVLIVRRKGFKFQAEVWGTQGLNDCPIDEWNALRPTKIKAKTGCLAVVLNGPRFWLPNKTTGSIPERKVQQFGALKMRRLATLNVNPGQNKSFYREISVNRSTTFVFSKGEFIYELVSPDGNVYVMQSMSQAVEPDLTIESLPGIGEKLKLPTGWRFQTRQLKEDLVLKSKGKATVIQDNLRNAYQRR